MTDEVADPDPVPPPAGERRGRIRPMTLVRAAFVVVAVGLGIYAVARDLDGFLDAVGRVGAVRTLLALALVLVGLSASAEVWRQVVTALAGDLSPRAARSVFFVSQLGKYVPGGVWTIAAQIDLATRHGLRRSSMGAGALLFLAVHLATGLLVAGLTLPVGAPELVRDHRWALALVVVAGVVGLLPVVLNRASDLGLRLLRRTHPPVRLPTPRVVLAAAWMAVVWACFGLATTIVAIPLLADGGAGTLAAAATGGFAIAWVVGVLVIPAPAGVGAREVAFVLVLSPLLGVTAATSVAILLRVIHTIADLSLAALTTRIGSRSSSG